MTRTGPLRFSPFPQALFHEKSRGHFLGLAKPNRPARLITQLDPFFVGLLEQSFQTTCLRLDQHWQGRPDGEISALTQTLALLDPSFGGRATYEEASRLSQAAIPFVFFSPTIRPAWLSWAIELGALGWISTNRLIAHLIAVIEKLLNGELKHFWSPEARDYFDPTSSRPKLLPNNAGTILTRRQFEVFLHLAEGKTVKEVARVMRLSEKSVDSHKYRIMQRLKLHDRVHLSRLAIREGWIDP